MERDLRARMRKLPALTLLCVCVFVCVWAKQRRDGPTNRSPDTFETNYRFSGSLIDLCCWCRCRCYRLLPLPAEREKERLDSGIVIEFNRKYVSVYPLRRVYTARSTLIESKPTKTTTTSSPRTRAIRRSRRIRETGHESVGVASPQPNAIYRINCRGE